MGAGWRQQAPPDRRSTIEEKRRAERLQKILFARVHGAYGTYRAMVTNISRTGALLTITDRGFDASDSDLGLAGLMIASHFGEGIRIEFVDEPVIVEADVARLSEERKGDRGILWLGCSFRRPLADEACGSLGLPTPAEEAEDGTAPVPDPLNLGAPVVVVQGKIEPVKNRGGGSPPPPRGVRVTENGPLVGIRDLLKDAVAYRASDLHLKGGSPVRMRIDGELKEIGNRALSPVESESLVRELLSPEQYDKFLEKGDLDLAYALEGEARFRVNVLRAQRVMGLAIRRIPEVVPSVKELGLSPVCTKLADKPRGLVLVTGPTGSGKSTTLAAMLNHVNTSRSCHIVTMEDPIEFIHREMRAHITQREVGLDTENFASALKRALRQDPDVILVGEMRDLETIALAVTAAETGHLVFATLHTTSAPLTVDRIVDVFPPDQQRQIRMQLADALQGIICQMLLPRVGGGVVVAQEILIATSGVRALIREGKAPQISNLMQTGAKSGMQTLEDSLKDLVKRRQITREVAIAKANHPELLEKKEK